MRYATFAEMRRSERFFCSFESWVGEYVGELAIQEKKICMGLAT